METQKLSFEDFKNIVVERLGCEPEQVTMDASFQEDLNADSLDLVELIYAFEENTGLEIPDEDAEKITTVGQAWESRAVVRAAPAEDRDSLSRSRPFTRGGHP